jgi:hypothetical protein
MRRIRRFEANRRRYQSNLSRRRSADLYEPLHILAPAADSSALTPLRPCHPITNLAAIRKVG